MRRRASRLVRPVAWRRPPIPSARASATASVAAPTPARAPTAPTVAGASPPRASPPADAATNAMTAVRSEPQASHAGSSTPGRSVTTSRGSLITSPPRTSAATSRGTSVPASQVPPADGVRKNRMTATASKPAPIGQRSSPPVSFRGLMRQSLRPRRASNHTPPPVRSPARYGLGLPSGGLSKI